jgi:hypothetical protein
LAAGFSTFASHIFQMTQNPYMQRAKVWFFFCAATLIPAFLLSLACADIVMILYLIPPFLLFIGGMGRFLWRGFRWRAPSAE